MFLVFFCSFGLIINYYIVLFLSQGKKVKCSTSQAKHRLFIGNVPRNWGQEDMKKVVTKIGPGVESVELLKVCTFNLFN